MWDTCVYFFTYPQAGWSPSMFKINLINSSSSSSTETAEYRERWREREFIRRKILESGSKACLTPLFHNARWYMYSPSKLYAVSPLSSGTVTAFGNCFRLCILFYSVSGLSLPFPHHLIQNKTCSSWVPAGVSEHRTGSAYLKTFHFLGLIATRMCPSQRFLTQSLLFFLPLLSQVGYDKHVY